MTPYSPSGLGVSRPLGRLSRASSLSSAPIASAIVPSRKAASPNTTKCSSASPATQRRPSQMALRLRFLALPLLLHMFARSEVGRSHDRDYVIHSKHLRFEL